MSHPSVFFAVLFVLLKPEMLMLENLTFVELATQW